MPLDQQPMKLRVLLNLRSTPYTIAVHAFDSFTYNYKNIRCTNTLILPFNLLRTLLRYLLLS